MEMAKRQLQTLREEFPHLYDEGVGVLLDTETALSNWMATL